MRHEQPIRPEGLLAEIVLIGSALLMAGSLMLVLWQALEAKR